MGLNHCVFMGRVTKKPELSRLADGKAVTTNTIAVDRDYKDKDGNMPVDFIDFVIWGAVAEVFCRYCEKGRQIAIVGQLQSRKSISKKDGKQYTNWEIKVDELKFADSRNPNTHGKDAPEPSGEDDYAILDGPDDGLPF